MIIKKPDLIFAFSEAYILMGGKFDNYTDEIIIFSVIYILGKCCPTEIKCKPHI